MNFGLEGQVAVVVGGANGIGRAIVLELAGQRAQVAVVDRDPACGDLAQTLQQQNGVKSLGVIADVTDYERIGDAAAQIVGQLGRTDHVVYAAGTGSGKYGFPFWNLEPSDWKRVLDVNIMGAVHVAHAFTPQLIRSGRGSMLFLSSVAGQIGSQTDPPYSAAKAAIINFAQCAAKDLAAHNVRVNTICPGMVKTHLNRSVWQAWYEQTPAEQRSSYDQWAEEKIRRVSPLGRWQSPEDVAAMAVFLASERAGNITGQTINVDGGQVMHW